MRIHTSPSIDGTYRNIFFQGENPAVPAGTRFTADAVRDGFLACQATSKGSSCPLLRQERHRVFQYPRHFKILSMPGYSIMPLSVMMAAISRASVTSKAGLYTLTPGGAICVPPNIVTSSAALCSMGISAPLFIFKSNVLDGAAI